MATIAPTECEVTPASANSVPAPPGLSVDTPEIVYHDDIKPVLSVDWHPSGRLATGGADHMVRIWQIQRPASSAPLTSEQQQELAEAAATNQLKKTEVTFLANLAFHESTVNAVRFSPDGQYLASASDDKFVVIWQRVDNITPASENVAPTQIPSNSTISTEPAAPVVAPVDGLSIDLTDSNAATTSTDAPMDLTTTDGTATPSALAPTPLPFGVDPDEVIESKEKWVKIQLLRGHASEIYDLSWSPNSKELITGSIDSHTLVWNLETNSFSQVLKDHSGYVQGVCWDPLNQFLATQSSDRTLKIYERKRNTKSKSNKPQVEFVEKFTVKNRKMTRIGKEETAALKDMTNDMVDVGVTPQKKLQPLRLSLDSPVPMMDDQENQMNLANMVIETIGQVSEKTPMNVDPLTSPKKDVKEKVPTNTITRPLYMDDSYPSYFRRLAFSPDGQFLVTPAGQFHVDELGETVGVEGGATLLTKMKENSKAAAIFDSCSVCSQYHQDDNHNHGAVTGGSSRLTILPTCYVFHRSDFSKPIAHLPQLDPVVIIKFCPILFQLIRTNEGEETNEEKQTVNCEDDQSMTTLPYRMVFAVATTKQSEPILLYDTESAFPLCIIKNIHHSGLTDLVWSADGTTLISSSSDGYCTYININQEAPEIGAMLSEEEMASYHEFWNTRRDQIAAAVLTEGQTSKSAGPAVDGEKKKKKKSLGASAPEAKTAIVALLGAEPAPLPTWTPTTETVDGITTTTTPAATVTPPKAVLTQRTDEELYHHALQLLKNGERLTSNRMQNDCGTGPKRAKATIAGIDALCLRSLTKMIDPLVLATIHELKVEDFEDGFCREFNLDVGTDLRTAKLRQCDAPEPYVIPKPPKVIAVPAILDALALSSTTSHETTPVSVLPPISSDPIVIDATPEPTTTEMVKQENAAAGTTSTTPTTSKFEAHLPTSPTKQSKVVSTVHSTPSKSSPTTNEPDYSKYNSPHSTPLKIPFTVSPSGIDSTSNTKKRKSPEADSATKPKTTIMDMFRKVPAKPASATKSTNDTKPAVVDLTQPSVSLDEVPQAHRAKRRITPELVQASKIATVTTATTPATTTTAATVTSTPVKATSVALLDADADDLELIGGDDDDDVEKEYVVEKILKKRTSADGGAEYYVRWEGYGPEADSWEPDENINCQELIDAFEKSQKGRKRVIPTLITPTLLTSPPTSTSSPPVAPSNLSISSLSPSKKRKSDGPVSGEENAPETKKETSDSQDTNMNDTTTSQTTITTPATGEVHMVEVKKKRKIAPTVIP